MKYPTANFKTIWKFWSSIIKTTKNFQFLTILPPKMEVSHFPEVYKTFPFIWNIIEANHCSRLVYSESSQGGQICYITNSTTTSIETSISWS